MTRPNAIMSGVETLVSFHACRETEASPVHRAGSHLVGPITAIGLLFFFALPLQANDWPGWLGPHRNSISKETGWMKEWPKYGLKQIWKTHIGLGFSTVSVKDGRLFTTGHGKGKDTVYCLNAETGDEIWTHSYPCSLHEDSRGVPGTGATPTVDGDRVYSISRDGHLYCLDAASGEVVWFRNPHEELDTEMSMFGFIGSPLVTDRFVIVDVGAAVALDKMTGEIAWNTEDFGGTYSSPQSFSFDGQELVTVFNSTGLIILKVDTGEEFCRKPWPTPQFDTNTATPVIRENKILISSGYDRGYALLEISGATEPAILWEDDKARTYHNTWVLWEGHFYGFVEDELVCTEFETGQRRWSKKCAVKGCTILVDGMLIVLSEKGELILAKADPNEYIEISRSHNIGGRCWSLPILANGRIYLRNSKGLLVCLDARKEEKTEK